MGWEPNGRLSASTGALRTALDNVKLFHEQNLYFTNLVKCVNVSAHGVRAQIRARRPAAPGSGVKVEFAKYNLVLFASQYLQPPPPLSADYRETLSKYNSNGSSLVEQR